MTAGVWVAFLVLLAAVVALDLGVLSRRPRIVAPIEAATTTALWVLGAAGFGFLLGHAYEANWVGMGAGLGEEARGQGIFLQFFTAYVVELALNLDNVAVVALICDHFRVAHSARPRLLFWTVVTSLVVRSVLFAAGAALLAYDWVHWAFAAVLLVAAARVSVAPGEPEDFKDRLLVRCVRKIPVGPQTVEQRLFSRVDRRLRGTPLVLAVILAATVDLSFAFDSVPAAFAVSRDPFIAFAATALATLGLRSLFFWLADTIERPRFVHVGLVLVLVALAVKMMVGRYDHAATAALLGAVSVVTGGAIGFSALRRRRAGARRPSPLEDVAEAAIVARRNARKAIILIAGTAVLLGAVATAPLPGPGPVILIPLGLSILATEFLWARRLLRKAKGLRKQAEGVAARLPLWLPVGAALLHWPAAYAVSRLDIFPRAAVWASAAALFLGVLVWLHKAVAARRGGRSAGRTGAANADRSP